MKITLQSTVENNKTIETTNPMVSINIPFDDLTISEVVEYSSNLRFLAMVS